MLGLRAGHAQAKALRPHLKLNLAKARTTPSPPKADVHLRVGGSRVQCVRKTDALVRCLSVLHIQPQARRPIIAPPEATLCREAYRREHPLDREQKSASPDNAKERLRGGWQTGRYDDGH